MYTFVEARRNTEREPEDHLPAYWLLPDRPAETKLMQANLASFVLAAARTNANIFEPHEAGLLLEGFTDYQVSNAVRRPFETVFQNAQTLKALTRNRITTLAQTAIDGNMAVGPLMEEVGQLRQYEKHGGLSWVTAEGWQAEMGPHGIKPVLYDLPDVALSEELHNLVGAGVNAAVAKLEKLEWPADNTVPPKLWTQGMEPVFGLVENGYFHVYQEGKFLPQRQL